MIKPEIILADPPWPWSEGLAVPNRSVSRKYPTMTLEDLILFPVETLVANRAVLFLWAIPRKLPEAIELMKAWGFDYKTVAFVWVKQAPNALPFKGCGWYTRQNAELVLLGTRGAPVLPRVDKSISQIVIAPRTRHSEKPNEIQTRIDRLYDPSHVRLEMFARREYPGWHTWGNELTMQPLRSFLRKPPKLMVPDARNKCVVPLV